MGWYEKHVFNPIILDKSLDVPEVNAERGRLLAPASGEILEIGLGTGLNVPGYPPSVEAIVSVGPEAEVHPFATRRAAARGMRIAHTAGDARRLPFDAARFDTVVASLVLCTIPEPARAVRELARVLRPGGRLLFLEHVVAAGGARRVFQRLLNPVMRPLLCGCEVTRDTERTLVENGFSFLEIERHDLGPMAWLHRGVIRGVAEPR
jgi:ubiquinone/menaquinone biosynthesis C-methylase UbiE